MASLPGASTTQALDAQNGLDAPPPSPALQTGQNPGTPLGQLVPPVPSNQLPPDVLTGILQAGQSIATSLDAFAQATPDLAADWGAVKDALMSALSKVLKAGAGPTSPTSTGPNFPGGGMDRSATTLAPGGVG